MTLTIVTLINKYIYIKKIIGYSIFYITLMKKKCIKYNPIEAQVELTMATLSDYVSLIGKQGQRMTGKKKIKYNNVMI